MLMVIQFVSKEINCFLPLLKSCKNGVIDFLRQGDDITCVSRQIVLIHTLVCLPTYLQVPTNQHGFAKQTNAIYI